MSRKLMRVPMDFSWPLDETWEGYVNPHYRKCPDCENGSSPDGEWLQAIVRLLLLAGEPRPRSRQALHPHPYLGNLGNRPRRDPTPRMSELSTGLAGREPSIFGHDALDNWAAQKKILKAAGLSEDWGSCKTCGGHAIDPEVREKYEAWEAHDPPTGPGYQLWQDTSEGSPISPVFATLDELCQWAEKNATTFGSSRASAAEWKKMLLEEGFVHHKEGNMVFT